jgi:Lrp/AsnC family leucine-responsive transcriptional regulator
VPRCGATTCETKDLVIECALEIRARNGTIPKIVPLYGPNSVESSVAHRATAEDSLLRESNAPRTPGGLDDLDRRILAELARDGRISNSDLARLVGLSASSCWTRVRALERRGVIKGYAAQVNRAALGLPETVMVEVTLDKQRNAGGVVEAFIREIERLPEVVEAMVVAGDFDFYLRVVAASTADYDRFLREKLYRIPSVREARSIFILRDVPCAPSPAG